MHAQINMHMASAPDRDIIICRHIYIIRDNSLYGEQLKDIHTKNSRTTKHTVTNQLSFPQTKRPRMRWAVMAFTHLLMDVIMVL